MFETFVLRAVDVAPEVRIRYRVGGAGPAVVLLHGHPRTHTTWHRVAPLLAAAGYTVICPDLRGYGGSTSPAPTPDHRQASKRAVAGDIVVLLDQLGHRRFSVVGHDRGGYVAHRLAVDHPDRVERLAVLDCVPIGEVLARADARFARAWWHWFFYAQPTVPERVITADPDAWYANPANTAERMGAENYADHRAAIHNPAVVTAMLEDYRAGLGIDQANDDADHATGRRLTCPTLVLWSTRDDLPALHGDVLRRWQDWGEDIQGGPIDSGHHMAEEAPGELTTALLRFLSGEPTDHLTKTPDC